MITVVMTSPQMSGQITFTYNEAGYLAQLTLTEALEPSQYAFLTMYLPIHMDAIKSFMQRAPRATFIQKKLEVTFDMFWCRYDDKERSSKKKTQVMWDKMKEADQIKAYLYLPTYNRKRGTAEKKYATTYLNDELWNN